MQYDILDRNIALCLTKPRKSKPESGILPSTLEGCLVRVSDLIAYVGRDIEDAIEMRILKREKLPPEATCLLGNSNKDIINYLVMDVIHHSFDKSDIQFSPEAYEAMILLKKNNERKIYRHKSIQQQEEKFKRIVAELFEGYLSDLEKGSENSTIYRDFLLHMNDRYKSETPHARVVADYIAGMTDRFVLDQYLHRFMPEQIGYAITAE